ncbi:MAG: N(4)-(beta-N-acetylglucosaminyl)-L-asparaginase [Planctomycetota bacterium]|nr:N(4)-(beta-N-acetylglucosaminyl)-L-asparaginase [Planctomycetota bacterium]
MESSRVTRRSFLGASGAALAAGALPRGAFASLPSPADADCIAVSSANGIGAVATARAAVLERRLRPVSAAVQGVAQVEADPKDTSVGYGGLPNEDGVIQLDSACMDGPRHNAGAVGSLEGIMHPAQVAECVMDRTDHVLLVGPGAKRFALEQGFIEQDLSTETSRKAWREWQATRKEDDRLWPLNGADPDAPWTLDEKRPWGTIHCSVLAPNGDLGCCTTTSGLAWKIPGRVGDSPLIGCGLYCDNTVGSAGATGRGEAAILSGGSWLIVERMRMGDDPTEACLHALRRVSEQAQRAAAWQPALWAKDKPGFGLTFYAVRKDGLFGSATMIGRRGGPKFSVADAGGARHEECAILYELPA